MTADEALPMHLDFAVPLRIRELRGKPDEQLFASARECVDTICCHADDALYGGGHCREALNAIVDSIAILSRVPAGITIFGKHWHLKGDRLVAIKSDALTHWQECPLCVAELQEEECTSCGEMRP